MMKSLVKTKNGKFYFIFFPLENVFFCASQNFCLTMDGKWEKILRGKFIERGNVAKLSISNCVVAREWTKKLLDLTWLCILKLLWKWVFAKWKFESKKWNGRKFNSSSLVFLLLLLLCIQVEWINFHNFHRQKEHIRLNSWKIFILFSFLFWWKLERINSIVFYVLREWIFPSYFHHPTNKHKIFLYIKTLSNSRLVNTIKYKEKQINFQDFFVVFLIWNLTFDVLFLQLLFE